MYSALAACTCCCCHGSCLVARPLASDHGLGGLALGALPAGLHVPLQEEARVALLVATIASMLPQLLSSVFEPFFDSFE